ncbi:hypothetical protein [Streptomyces sp. NPDC002104]
MYEQQHAAALDEAGRASRACTEALRGGWEALTGNPHVSLLARGATLVLPEDAQSMDAMLETLRQRVPLLAARLDDRVTEDVQQLRAGAAAQNTAAARHRAKAVALQQENALREEMRTAAPVGHARETGDRAAALRQLHGQVTPSPSSRSTSPSPLPSPTRQVARRPENGMQSGSTPPQARP